MKGMIPAGGWGVVVVGEGGSRGAKGAKMAANAEQKLVNRAALLLLFHLKTPESQILKAAASCNHIFPRPENQT